MVRTHQPKNGTIQRIEQWANDLVEHRGASLMLMTTVDNTSLQSYGLERIRDNVSVINRTMFHHTNKKEIEEEYPVWKEMEVTHPHDSFHPWLWGRTWRPTGWDTHTEFILSAFNQVRRSGLLPEDGYVWVFEDDIGICGSMSELIASYADDTTDFIATHSLNKAPKTWPHYCEGSDAFLDMYPPKKRWHAAEHVTRFSVRFLLHLDAMIREHNVTSHSEMFPATVCMNSDLFKCSVMKREHFFPSAFLCGPCRINETRWEEICSSKKKHSPPRVSHALKW